MYKLNNIESLITKKEIYDVFNEERNDDEKSNPYTFVLKYYQKIGQILVNENTPYKRLLCIMETGTGKTLFSLNIGYNLSKIYYNQWLIDGKINGYIIILGFTSDLFQTELLTWLNFGFVNEEELRQYNQLKLAASTGRNIEEYIAYSNMLRRRFKYKAYRGFYQFFGYKKFSNDLFILPPKIDLLDYTIDEVIKMIDDGKIQLNETITSLFKNKNSVLICDEFHELYNSVKKNTYGYAVKVLLHYYPETRLVGLTATEINNNSTEAIDLYSFLEYKDKAPVYSDLFDAEGNFTTDQSKLDKLFTFLSGKIFLYRNTDTRNYPDLTQHGEYLDEIKEI